MLAAPSPRRGDRPSVGTGQRERAPEKKSAFQYRHPPLSSQLSAAVLSSCTGRRERAPEKKSAFQHRHPPPFLRIVCRDISLLSYRCCLVVSPSPGHAANDLNGGGIAVEKVAARKGGKSRRSLLPLKFPPHCLPRYLPAILPLLPGGLTITRTRGQRFEWGGYRRGKGCGEKRG
jgi:hypothetical protein